MFCSGIPFYYYLITLLLKFLIDEHDLMHDIYSSSTFLAYSLGFCCENKGYT